MLDTQVKVLKRWNKAGVGTHFIPIGWSNNESFETKLKRVVDQIDEFAKAGGVSLVGTSAGASMAMNAYCERKSKVSGVVFICGKLRNAEGVGEKFFRRNPAFRKSIFNCQANLEKLTIEDKAKMMTLRSAFDGLIPVYDSEIPGVKSRTLPFIIHIPTIGLALTVFKNWTIGFLKAQAE